jgi:hypothetical protein
MDELEIFRRIHEIEKTLHLSPSEVFGLQTDLSAAIFLRNAQPKDEERLWNEPETGSSDEQIIMALKIAQGALAALQAKGVSRETADQCIERRLSDLEKLIPSKD